MNLRELASTIGATEELLSLMKKEIALSSMNSLVAIVSAKLNSDFSTLAAAFNAEVYCER